MTRRLLILGMVLALLVAGTGMAFPDGEAALDVKPRLQLLNPPTNLSATAVSQTQIDLAWDYTDSGQDGFRIERSPDGSSWGFLANAGASDRAYGNSGLTCGTQYYYRVRAYSAVLGTSNWSGTANDTTFACPATPVPTAGPTSPPVSPLPTPIPGSPGGGAVSPRGSTIRLRVHPAGVPVDWTQLWTVVQWQAGDGVWSDVEDWQGLVDDIEEAGTGLKSWWVSEDDITTGPFRWLVYDRQGGRVVGTSETFDLPDFWREILVEVALHAPAAAAPTAQASQDSGSGGSLPGTGLASPIVYIGALGGVLAVFALGVAAVRGYLKREKKKDPDKPI